MRCATFSMRSPNSTTILILFLPIPYRFPNSLIQKKTSKLLGFFLPSLLGGTERALLRVRPTLWISSAINPMIISSIPLLPIGIPSITLCIAPLISSTCAIAYRPCSIYTNIMAGCMTPYAQKQTKHLWMMPLGDSEVFFLKSITPIEPTNTSPTQPRVLLPNEFICFCDGW